MLEALAERLATAQGVDVEPLDEALNGIADYLDQ